MVENQLSEPLLKQANSIQTGTLSKTAGMDQLMKNFRSWSPLTHKDFKGHLGPVYCCSITSDNSTVFSGSKDKTVKIWNAETQECLFTFTNNVNLVNALDLVCDEKYLVSGDWSGKIFVWDWKARTLYKELIGHTQGITRFILSRGQDYLLSAGDDCARIWKLPEFESVGSLNCDGFPIFALAINKNFTEIVCAGEQGSIWIFDFPELDTKAQFQANANKIQAMCLTSDDKFLIIGTQGNLVKVYNYKERTEYYTFTTHKDWIRDLVVSKDDKFLISISEDRSFRIFNINTKTEELIIEGTEGYFLGGYLSKDEKYLLIGCSDSIMRIWNFSRSDRVRDLKGHTKTIKSLAVTSDDKFIVTGSEDCTVRIWSLVDFCELAVLNAHNQTVWSVAVTNDCKLIASASADKNLILWDFNTREVVAKLTNQNCAIFSAVFNNQGTMAVSGGHNSTVAVWDVEKKCLKKILTGHTSILTVVQVSYDDKFFMSGALDYTILIWSFETLEIVHKIETKSAWFDCISLSNDGKHLAFGDRSGKLHLLDWNTRTPIKTFTKHKSRVSSASFLKGNNLIVSASHDLTLRVWNVYEERQEFMLNGHTGLIHTCGLTSDSNYVISAGEDLKIKIWNISDYDPFEMADCVSSLDNFLFLSKISMKLPSSSIHRDHTFGKLRINLAHFYAYVNYDILLYNALMDGVEIKRDIEGHTPLFYAIARSSQNCIDMILKYMILIKNLNISLFLHYSHAMRDDFGELISNISVYLPDFLEEIFYTVNELPNFAYPKVNLPILHFGDSKEIDVNQFVFKIEEVPDGAEEIPIEFKTLPFPITFHGGSNDSISLLKSIIACPNSRILQTKFIKSYITNKWNNDWPFILFLTLVIWLNIALMVVTIVKMYNISWLEQVSSEVLPELIGFIIVNLILTFYELLQCLTTGLSYFSEGWNMVDIIRSTLCIVWGLMSFEFTQEDLFVITWIMVVLNFFRGLTGFRAFSTTRYYIRLIIRAFRDSVSFLLIFFYSTFAFGVIYFLSLEGKEKTIFKLWSSPYQLNMGEISEANIESPATYLYFMMASVINVIIMLNLLISILGDSFDSFQMKALQIDFLEQAELILEIETLMFWKRQLNEKKFMQTCQELTVEEDHEWEGRIKMIITTIKKMRYEINTGINELRTEMKNEMNEMKKLIQNKG